jgi:hypothetical protein
LSQRIEAAYMRRTGSESPRGARAWFARQAQVHPYTVSRWLAGAPFSGPPLAVLELLEAAPACSPLDAPDEPRSEARGYTIRDALEIPLPEDAERIRAEHYQRYLEARNL